MALGLAESIKNKTPPHNRDGVSLCNRHGWVAEGPGFSTSLTNERPCFPAGSAVCTGLGGGFFFPKDFKLLCFHFGDVAGISVFVFVAAVD